MIEETPFLIVDDDRFQRMSVSALVRNRLLASTAEADSGEMALAILASSAGENIRVVVLDHQMPGLDGLETLARIKTYHPHCVTVMLTGTHDTEHAAQAIKIGAFDFVAKPFQPERLTITLKNALKMALLHHELDRVRQGAKENTGFHRLIGPDLRHLKDHAHRMARSEAPILIEGETGVGKDVLARALHEESSRTGGPYIAVNCAALPPTLVESTLFGHEKGAFTGATSRLPGKFREADGGTLFLDEIGELPLEIQAKLLRALQQREVEPVGASRPEPVNIRIIAATHRNLERAVRQGAFREDLFFRLNVLQLLIPPLRDRPNDLLSLAQHFLEGFALSDQRPLKTLSPQAIQAMLAYRWPGNVRELENILRRAVILSDRPLLGEVDLGLSSLPETPMIMGNGQSGRGEAGGIALLDARGDMFSLAQIEDQVFRQAIALTQGNMTLAAQRLGIAKSTLYRRLNRSVVE